MKRSKTAYLLLYILGLNVVLTGCVTTYGARTVPNARFDYNENIVRSRDEQMLVNLVRLSKNRPTFFLDVTGVNTSYEYTGNAGAKLAVAEGAGRKITTTNMNSTSTAGTGATETTESNTVQRVSGLPSTLSSELSGGVSYKETPTITYKPLQGPKFAKRLMSPIDTGLLLYLIESGRSIDRLMDCCIQRINGISDERVAKVARNWVVVEGQLKEPAGYDLFSTIAKSMTAAQEKGFVWFERVHVLKDDDEEIPDRAFIKVDCEAKQNGKPTTDFILDKLGLKPVCPSPWSNKSQKKPTPKPREEQSYFKLEGDDIQILPRSLIGFMRALVASPTDNWHRLCGSENSVAIQSPEPNPILVCSSVDEPGQASAVAARYENRWYWIPAGDAWIDTFALLIEIFDLQASMDAPGGPALTLGLR